MFKAEVLNDGLAGKLYIESLRNLLAVHLLRNYNNAVVKPALEKRALDIYKLNSVKDFIEERLAEDLSIADLAAVVHMSQFHFARTFKAATGNSPHRYLTQLPLSLLGQLRKISTIFSKNQVQSQLPFSLNFRQ